MKCLAATGKFLTLLLLFGLLVIAGCQRFISGQVITVPWSQETDVVEEWTPIPPPVVIRTSQESTITALFVGECQGGVFIDPGAPQRFHLPLLIRIKIGGEVADPPSARVCGEVFGGLSGLGGPFQTASFLAVRRNMPAGTHTVQVEARASAPEAKIWNRALTVLEGIPEGR
jgi:hypothetical protein